ncbi:hypothetical protein D9615_008259 [Tricholomella constricta]|uniref:EamA domain-containing protein n=1 Tax=Tricholomella constricta TaxID=117010 RepID=A0A8H5H3K4_9AGAR|nr:hypothetical protein D9615_008259 [Tricholomella constricta]
MSPRGAYTALGLHYAQFPAPHTTASGSSQDLSAPGDDLPQQHGSRTWRWREKCRAVEDVFKSNTGLLLVTASQAFFSMMNTAVKKLNSIDPPVSTFELIAVRMIITYVCSMTYMIWAKVPDPWLGPKGVRLLLVFRGFSGFFGLLGIYYSLQYLSLSDATVLTFLAPLCTGISGAMFLKERYSKREALASVCSLLGVVLIARPAFLFGEPSSISSDPRYAEKGTPEERLFAVGVALVGVLGLTGAYTSLTALGKRAHPLHAMTAFSSQCIVVSCVAMLIQKAPIVVPTEIEWLLLLLMIGIFGFVAQILLTMGLQRETAGRGTIAVYTQVVFAAILERIFFDPAPSIMSIFGTLIIISAALYVAVRLFLPSLRPLPLFPPCIAHLVMKDQTKTQNHKDRNTTSNTISLRLRQMPDRALEDGLLEGLLACENPESNTELKRAPGEGAHPAPSRLTLEETGERERRGLQLELELDGEETSALPVLPTHVGVDAVPLDSDVDSNSRSGKNITPGRSDDVVDVCK